jgi:hypothetical protein
MSKKFTIQVREAEFEGEKSPWARFTRPLREWVDLLDEDPTISNWEIVSPLRDQDEKTILFTDADNAERLASILRDFFEVHEFRVVQFKGKI